MNGMRKRPLCLICIGLMLVIWICRQAGIPIFGEPASALRADSYLEEHSPVRVTGTISGRMEKPNSTQYYLKNSYLLIRQEKIPVHKILLTTQAEECFPVGAVIEAAGSLERLQPPGNPGEFDSSAYYGCQGIYYSMWGEELRALSVPDFSFGEMVLSVRETVTEGLFRITGPETAGVLAAMVFGDREALPEETGISYRITGVTHILSVSGLHFSMLGSALFGLLLRLRVRQAAAAGTAAALMGFYCLLTGGQAAAVRAFIMFGAMLGARLLRRSYDLLSALALAAILLLLGQPGYLFYSGFQLSFAAVLGIGTVYPVLRRFLPKWCGREKACRAGAGRRKVKKALKTLAESVLSWGAVTAATQPLVCFWFYEVPVWSLPVNLLLLPTMNLVMISGMAGGLAAMVWPALGKILVFPAAVCLRGYDFLTGAVRFLPGAAWICGQPEIWQAALFYAGLTVCVLLLKAYLRKREERQGNRESPGHARLGKGRKGRRERLRLLSGAAAVMVLSCAVLFRRQYPEFSLTALDVGQGDCLVLNRGGNLCYLVDGGSSSEKNAGKYRILTYLKQQGIGTVEGIFLTHPDEDHMNGILELLEMIAGRETSLTVKQIFLPEWMKESEEERPVREGAARAGVPVRYLKRGDGLTAGELRVKVLYPPEGEMVSGNEGSLTLLVSYGAFDALLTGDLEGKGETEAAELAGQCDYLKVAHHGSKNSTGEQFLEATAPKICVISAPERSLYGHPHPEVLERMENAGGDWYQTGLEGAVTAEVRDGEVLVTGYRRNVAIDEKVVYTGEE